MEQHDIHSRPSKPRIEGIPGKGKTTSVYFTLHSTRGCFRSLLQLRSSKSTDISENHCINQQISVEFQVLTFKFKKKIINFRSINNKKLLKIQNLDENQGFCKFTCFYNSPPKENSAMSTEHQLNSPAILTISCPKFFR